MKKTIWITGASSGIGLATCRKLLHSGHSVLGVGRRAPSDELAKLIKGSQNTFTYVQRDLTSNTAEIPSWVLELSKTHGRFSGLVHSAGIGYPAPTIKNTPEKMSEIFDVNVFSALMLANGISDRRAASKEGVSIVFISSISAITGAGGLVNYSASKAAINGAMRSLAKELAPRKIRVNSVLPGFVQTEMSEHWLKAFGDDYLQKIDDSYPLGLGSPDDVAAAVSFLLSGEAKWITGTEMVVDGGATLGT